MHLPLSMIAGLLMCLELSGLGDTCRLCLDLGRTRRTHGVKQLLATVDGLYADLLWVWSGVFERLPRVWQLPFAIALFTFQVALSRWWLQRFRFGPCEWLWRSFTYLRWEPLRVASTAR